MMMLLFLAALLHQGDPKQYDSSTMTVKELQLVNDAWERFKKVKRNTDERCIEIDLSHENGNIVVDIGPMDNVVDNGNSIIIGTSKCTAGARVTYNASGKYKSMVFSK